MPASPVKVRNFKFLSKQGLLTVAIPLMSTSAWTRLVTGEVVEREAERVEGWTCVIKEQVDVFETALIRDVGSIFNI